jgi:hypothetical protein
MRQERAMNGEHSSEYDTSGLYRGAERIPAEAIPPRDSVEPSVSEDAAASVADRVGPAASAVLMYSEYLLAAATGLPREQREILDLLRRQAHVVMWGLSALVAAEAGRASEAAVRREESAIA